MKARNLTMAPDIKTAKVASARSNSRGLYWAALFLFVSVGLAYSNSLDAIWTLDDNQNILENSRLHVKDLQIETLYETFFSPLHLDQEGCPRLNRPIAHLTFALNWFVGQNSPVGYRLVNILIHILTALVLFFVIRGLLRTPNMRGAYSGQEGGIALLAALLWALNPIHTQAVVYIVQRMASLACFFYLTGIWCFLLARTSATFLRRLLFYSLTGVSLCAGLGSKENVILLPVALILLEFTFFADWDKPSVRRRARFLVAISLLVVLIGGLWLALHRDLSSLLGYNGRLFSLNQRLMTQPRIVIFYISQIFYPIPTRLSIVHDVDLSRSLLDPWTTLPALLFVVGLIGFGFLQIRKRPIFSFAILFFFLNHAIESSIYGLELIFEHRNYLPSLFLFVPVAIGLIWVITYHRSRNSMVQYVLVGFVVCWVAGLGVGTYVRNMAWLDSQTFWEDAARKAPLSLRPVANLAFEYYERKGDYRQAFNLYHKALELQDYNLVTKSLLHVNIALHYYKLAGSLSNAREHVDKSLVIWPDFEQALHLKSILLYRSGELDQAYAVISSLVSRRPYKFEYHYTLSQVLLKMGRIEEALSRLGLWLGRSAQSNKAYTQIGIAMAFTGDFQSAEWFFRRAVDVEPGDKRALLWMIDCKLKTEQESAASELALEFLVEVSAEQIEPWIHHILDDGLMDSDSKQKLVDWISSQASAQQHRVSKRLQAG